MPTETNILILGGTGYIGGSVLLRLLDHPNASNFKIRAVSRSPEKWNQLRKMGINSVYGSLSDLSLLESLASQADVVVSMRSVKADADDLEAVKAILKGLKDHHTETEQCPIFIHTSGTCLFADTKAGGRFSNTQIYDDSDVAQIETIPDTQPHRVVDLELVRADKEGYVKTYIVLPATIYGVPNGRLVEQGIQNSRGIALPSLVRAASIRGRAGIIGSGMNYWPNVHIDDVADLYLIIFNAALTKPETTGHGRAGYYIAENGEHTQYQVADAICQAMIAVGESSESEPSPFTSEEIQEYFNGSKLWACHCRCRATRSRALGWKPKKATVDMLASIRLEVEETLVMKKIYEQYGLVPIERYPEKPELEAMDFRGDNEIAVE
ncbi:NAD(P)-binding protein [Pholiota conissans]|uniref:NAD(P)-binding protein n=1 Tax=Pholiota conissans TaxID=109636 RepID=A0A9P5YUP3_9AGAR|nr:NAD(P)-binding protein [Pholiota conissans]